MTKTSGVPVAKKPDFSYMDAMDIKGVRKTFTLKSISLNGANPKLIVRPATKDNGDYWTAMLVAIEKRKPTSSENGAIAVSDRLDANRSDDRKMYPKYVIVGWEDVLDGNGGEVAFTMDHCAAFITKLPDWQFDKLREFCSEPANFAQLSFELSEGSGKK